MDDTSVPQDVVFFHGAFVHYITSGESTAHPQDQSRTSASLRKLAGFSDKHLIELSADMYDELQRRLNPTRASAGPLSPRKDIHWKRNDARKHVGSLPDGRFHEICRDLITEQERRYSDLTTGPTYPLQDATPMRDLRARMSQASTGDSDRSRSSDRSRPRLNISTDHVIIQSVNESNVTPTKVQIVESDSEFESDDDDQPSNTPMFAELLDPAQSPQGSEASKEVPSEPAGAEAGVSSNEPNGTSRDLSNDGDAQAIERSPESPADHVAEKDETNAVRAPEHLGSEARSDSYAEANGPNEASKRESQDSDEFQDSNPGPGPEYMDMVGEKQKMLPDTQSTPQASPDKRDRYPMSPSISSGSPLEKATASRNLNSGTETAQDREDPHDARSLQSQQDLKARLEEQQRVTDEIRRNAARFLEEMRALTERCEQQISRADNLDAEATRWRKRHAKLGEELEASRKQKIEAAIAVPVLHDPWPEELVSATGKVDGNDLQRVMSAISLLASATHNNSRSKNLLDLLHRVVLASQEISKDDKMIIKAVKQLISVVRNYTVSKGLFPKILVDSACSDIAMAVIQYVQHAGIKAGTVAPQNAGLKLGTSAKNSPDLDAPDHNSRALVSGQNSTKNEPKEPKLSPKNNSEGVPTGAVPLNKPESLESRAAESEPVKFDPVGPNTVRSESIGSEPIRPEPVRPDSAESEPVNSKAARPEPARSELVQSEPVKSESAVASQSRKPRLDQQGQAGQSSDERRAVGRSVESIRTASGHADHDDHESEHSNRDSGATQSSHQRLASVKSSSSSLSEVRSVDIENLTSHSPISSEREARLASRKFLPKQGPELALDESIQHLQTYLEDQTSGTVESIGSLLSGIKGNATAGELKPLVVQIQTQVGEMIDFTETTLAQTRSRMLKDRGTFILRNLRDCLARMDMLREEELEAIRSDAKPNRHLKQRLAGVNFDMAKSTKELVKTVEEVVLQDEVADIDRKLS